MTAVQPGRYRHYKGKEYTVLGVALHSETKEELVIYRPEYGERGLWVRPKQMFLETLEVDGRPVPRFQHIAGQGDGSRPAVEMKVFYLEMFGRPPGKLSRREGGWPSCTRGGRRSRTTASCTTRS